jgi:hypothetical protein
LVLLVEMFAWKADTISPYDQNKRHWYWQPSKCDS